MTNLKLVLRTYSALRQMSPDDIALLETLRALNESDRELMVETLQGKATARKAGKKSSKSSQSSSKSSRASGMEAQLKERRQGQRGTPDDSGDENRFDGKSAQDARDEFPQENNERCTYIYPSGDSCQRTQDHNCHHLATFIGYHPFVPSTTAPPAPAPSPANGASSATERNTRRPAPPSTPESGDRTERNASLSGANSEASAVSAGAAMGGSSE